MMEYTGTCLSMEQARWFQCPTWFNFRTEREAFQWIKKMKSDGKFSLTHAGGYGPGRFSFQKEEDCLLFSIQFAGTDKEWL